jgi:hypothetical protein
MRLYANRPKVFATDDDKGAHEGGGFFKLNIHKVVTISWWDRGFWDSPTRGHLLPTYLDAHDWGGGSVINGAVRNVRSCPRGAGPR